MAKKLTIFGKTFDELTLIRYAENFAAIIYIIICLQGYMDGVKYA